MLKGECNNSILRELLEKLTDIRLLTTWGRKQNLDSIRRYLTDELVELREAVATEDFEAIAEEIGDVLMLALLFIEFLQDEAHQYSLEAVARTVSHKLDVRYPDLVNRQQLTFSWAFSPRSREQEDYDIAKKFQKVLAFAYCPNAQCPSHLDPGSQYLSIFTRRGWPLVKCAQCDAMAPIRECIVFPKRDEHSRRSAIKIVAQCVIQQGEKAVTSSLAISASDVEQILLEARDTPLQIANLLRDRFQLDPNRVIAYFQNSK